MGDFAGDLACEGPGAMHFGCVCLVAEINRQADENARLRDALGWYADRANYDAFSCPCEPDCVASHADIDAGKRAHAALRAAREGDADGC